MLGTGNEPPKDTLGQRIKAVRTAKNLRLGETATKIGVSRTSFGQWEADAVKNPDMDKLAAFSRIADVSLDWLVNGSGDNPPFLAAPRKAKTTSGGGTTTESISRTLPKQEAVPEIASPLTAHATGFDMTPRAFWAIPQEVLELSFNMTPGRAIVKRVVTLEGRPFGLSRGDYVLIDTGRNRINEPGIYVLADPEGICAKRALVDDKLKIVQLGDDTLHGNPQVTADMNTVLGRVMAIFKSV